MATGYGQEIATGGIGRRLVGVCAATLCAAAVLTLVPTGASAFNIEGLIGGALAARYGGYHHGRSAGHHARSHESSRHEHESAGKEKDATEVDATEEGGKTDSKVSLRRAPSGIKGNTLQASTSGGSDRAAADEPAFAPSR